MVGVAENSASHTSAALKTTGRMTCKSIMNADRPSGRLSPSEVTTHSRRPDPLVSGWTLVGVTKVNAAVKLGRVRHQRGPIVRDWSEQTGRKGGVGCA